MSGSCPVYEFRVRGHLDQHWAGWLDELTVRHNDDGTSTLTAPITDQAALHGLLAQVRDLGVALISVAPAASTELASSQGAQAVGPGDL